MKIFDLHNDALTGGGVTSTDSAVYAIWTTELTLSNVTALIDAHKSKMLAIEDCGVFLSNRAPLLENDFMYCGLTWNEFNGLAGGANSDEHLTDKGREIIRLLNEKGAVIDTAHLNRASFYEVIEQSRKIICSHTCFYEVNNHPRNLTREQISAIIERGGIIGLCFVGKFLGGNEIESVLRHIDWFLENFGSKNLAIGTDFYGSTDLPVGLASYKDFDNLILAMIRRGYSDSVIHNILYGNAISYFFES